MQIKSVTLLLLCSLITSSLYAQGLARNDEFSPKSPEMASMPRFDSQSINEYNGKANITIPLASLPFDNKSINLNLSYDTGGIRTDQEASWVGLGWSLTGIPSISRRINGGSDIASLKHQPRSHGYAQNGISVPGYNSPTFIDELENSIRLSNQIFVDTQPDIFTANLLNESVSFKLAPSGPTTTIINGVILDDSRAIIRFNNEAKNFTITDESGYVYLFEDKEYASNFMPAGQFNGSTHGYWTFQGHSGDFIWKSITDVNIITSWQITKIISPNGLEMKFNYSGDKYDPVNDITLHYYPHLILSPTRVVANAHLARCEDSGGGVVTIPGQTRQWSRSILEVKYPREIINLSTGERIIFKMRDRDDIVSYDNSIHLYAQNMEPTSGPNVDHGNAQQLNKLEHYSNTGDILKNISFETSYFNQDDISNQFKDNFLRLKLDKVSIDNQNYDFDYEQPNNLPYKTTSGSDFWGFNNGRTSDPYIPRMVWDESMSVGDCFGVLPTTFTYNGGRKGSDFTYGKIGTLTKLTYPTSGYSTYDYESNTVNLTTNTSSTDFRKYTLMYLETNNNEVGYPKGNILPLEDTYAVGGLRVSSINNFDKNDQLVTKTDFSYNQLDNTNEHSSGVLMDDLLYYYIYENWGVNNVKEYVDLKASSSNKFYPINSAQNTHVGYSRVEMKKIDVQNNQNNGRIVREYINESNERLQSTTTNQNTIDTPPVNFENGNGKVTKEQIFNGDVVEKLIQETSNTYQNVEQKVADAWKVYYSVVIATFSDQGASYTGQWVNAYDYFIYPVEKSYSLLLESRVKDYLDDGDNVERISTYSYNGYNHLSSKTVTSPTDPNFQLRKEYYYPYSPEFGISQLVRMPSLVEKNRVASPVYQRQYRNNRFVGHSLYTFSGFGSKILPSSLKYSPIDIADVTQMDTELTYVDYNEHGKLNEFNIEDGMSTRYIWGNEHSDVIAKVVNYDDQSIEPEMILDKIVVDNPVSLPDQINAEIDKVRGHLDYAKAHISDYAHISGVGPTRIRNEREEKSSFYYDDNERLIEIKDLDNKYLQSYQYNITNTDSTCLNCLPKISLISNLGYDIYIGENLTITRSIPSGQGSILKWELYVGDELREKGTGSPPSSFGRTFESSGLKPIRLFTFHSNGNTLSGNLNVRVYEGSIPGNDVFFDNIAVINVGEKSATLEADPNSTVTFRIQHQGGGSGHTGYVNIGGQAYNTSLGTNITGQINLTNGSASCIVRNNGGSGSSGLQVSLNTTTRGQIGNPANINITRY